MSAVSFAKFRTRTPNERMLGQQFARRFKRVEKTVGGDGIEIENVGVISSISALASDE